MFVAIAALVGTGAVVRSIPYEPGMGKKQAWLPDGYSQIFRS